MRSRMCWLVISLFLLAIAITAYTESETKDPLLNKPAPDFKLKDVGGKEWKLSALKGKKVVLLDFGRSICTKCRKTAKDLQKLHEKYEKKGLQVFAVNLDGPRADERVAEYVKEEKLTFPILRDIEFKVADAYKVGMIPHLVLIDSSGTVRYVHQGYQENLTKVLSDKIEPLLQKKPG